MLVGTAEKRAELEEEEPLEELAEEDDAAEATLLLLKALAISGLPTKAPPRRQTITKTNNCFKTLERFNSSSTSFSSILHMA
jgi:hypothetical protein